LTRQLNINQALQLAQQQFEQGREHEADLIIEEVCRVLSVAEIQLELRANVALQRRRYEQAIQFTEQLAALVPARCAQFLSLGVFAHEQGAFDVAERCALRYLASNPASAEAHYNLACLYLLTGRYAEAWIHFEQRYALRQAEGYLHTDPAQMWDGTVDAEATLLVDCEQGFGDSLKFARYFRWAAARVGRVVLRCAAPLIPLFRELSAVQECVAVRDPVPAHTRYCPAGRLASLHDSRPETIPGELPYLQVPEGQYLAWRQRLGNERLKVGLVWAGNSKQGTDWKRSVPGEALRPLLEVPGVDFFSLQVGPRSHELQDPRLVDLAPALHDFGATAGAVAALDLIITVDTSVAHLAGALGRPVWIMIAAVPYWPYGLGSDRTPWYPSARLFRQPASNDWLPVFAAVHAALHKWARAGNPVLHRA